MKREISEKARLAYRLLYILQDDIDDLRINTHKYNLEGIIENSARLNQTLNDLIDTIVDLETAVILEKVEDAREKQSL